MGEEILIDLGTAKLKARVTGCGPAIVFLHAGVADHRMWTPQLLEFERTHTVIAYDRRGFGKTTSEDVPFCHFDDLAKVMDHLALDRAILCGCSQGARVALDFAIAHPDRAEALILIGATYSGAPWEDITNREIELVSQLEAAEEQEDLSTINQLEARLWLDGPSAQAGRVSQSLKELFLDMNGIVLRTKELTQELEPPDASTALANIACPTLLIEGELDFEMIHRHHNTLHTAINRSERIEMPETAHLPSMEKPSEFNLHVRRFLE